MIVCEYEDNTLRMIPEDERDRILLERLLGRGHVIGWGRASEQGGKGGELLHVSIPLVGREWNLWNVRNKSEE